MPDKSCKKILKRMYKSAFFTLDDFYEILGDNIKAVDSASFLIVEKYITEDRQRNEFKGEVSYSVCQPYRITAKGRRYVESLLPNKINQYLPHFLSVVATIISIISLIKSS